MIYVDVELECDICRNRRIEFDDVSKSKARRIAKKKGWKHVKLALIGTQIDVCPECVEKEKEERLGYDYIMEKMVLGKYDSNNN